MKKTIPFRSNVFVNLIVFVLSFSSLAAQTFPDYALSVETTTWQSIASTGTRLTQATNTYTQTITLPFDLEFGGATITQGSNVKVSARGRINFGNYGAYTYAHTHWNSPSGEFAIIPFFVEMSEMASGGGAWWLVRDDDRGGQELVVEWNGLRRYGASGDNVNYQVHIHSNGDIAVCYGPMTLQAGYWDTVFTFAVVHHSAADRVLITGTWDTDSSITMSNPSSIGSSPLMLGVPQSGLLLTYVRPLPPCPHPTHLTAVEVWQNGATLRWTGNGVAGAQYLVQYSTADFTPGEMGHPSFVATDTQYVINGLLADQQYYAYVRSDCAPDTSRWEGVQFQTSCNGMTHSDLPYTQHFDSVSESSCWRMLGQVAWSSQSGSGANLIRFCHLFFLDSYAIMPPIDYVGDLQVSFRVKMGPVMVGVMDDPSDTSTFMPLHECPATSVDWSSYTVRLSRYDGNGQYVAFKTWPNQYGVGGCWIDDVVLDTIQGCIAVENLRAARYNATSADIRWDDYDSVGNYLVRWVSGSSVADSAVVTTTNYTIMGLTPETAYTISVRILCDSLTSGPDTAITLTTRPTCMQPTALTADIISNRSVAVHWTEVNNIGTYRVVLKETYGDTVSVDTVVADTSIVYSGLSVSRQYTVYVSQLCSGMWTEARWETFRTEYSCPGPQAVTVDTVGTTWAEITIADTVGGSHLIVVQTTTQTDTIVTDSLHLMLARLIPASSYYVRVSSLCADSTYSGSVQARFSTPCSIITHAQLPYVETFDNCFPGDAWSLSPCWNVYTFAPANFVGTYYPTARYHHGTSGLSLYVNARSNSEPGFVVLPEVDSLTDLVLSMAVCCNWAGDARVDIGVMTNPTDTATFQPLGTYIPSVSGQWVAVEVPLAAAAPAAHHAAMRVGVVGTSGDALYFDNVTLGFSLSCDPPDSLVVSDITDSSALLTIVPSVTADTDAAAYRVVVASVNGSDTLVATSAAVALSCLSQATDYTVRVHSICPEGGVTLATGTSFTTACGVVRLPWFDDFESRPLYRMPRCWALTDTASVPPEVRQIVPPHSGSRALATVGVGRGMHSSFATPQVAPCTAPVVLDLYARAYEYTGPDTSFVSLRVSLLTDSGITILFMDKVLYSDWTHLQYVAPAGLLAGGGRFEFRVGHMDDSSSHPVYLHIDDISIAEACLPVTAVRVAVADTIPAGLTCRWLPQGTEDQWVVDVWNDTYDTSFTTVSPTADLGMLASLTDYCLAVEPLCPPSAIAPDSAVADTVCFTTPDLSDPTAVRPSSAFAFSLYPNPSRGDVTVRVGEPATVTVMDVSGRTVMAPTHVKSSFLIRRSSLPAGAYFVRCTAASGCHVAKLVLR